MDELKSWVVENKMEKPEWVPPVIIFDKESKSQPDGRPRRRNSGVRKMNLRIGIDDDKPKRKEQEVEQVPNLEQVNVKPTPELVLGLQLSLPTRKKSPAPSQQPAQSTGGKPKLSL